MVAPACAPCTPKRSDSPASHCGPPSTTCSVMRMCIRVLARCSVAAQRSRMACGDSEWGLCRSCDEDTARSTSSLLEEAWSGVKFGGGTEAVVGVELWGLSGKGVLRTAVAGRGDTTPALGGGDDNGSRRRGVVKPRGGDRGVDGDASVLSIDALLAACASLRTCLLALSTPRSVNNSHTVAIAAFRRVRIATASSNMALAVSVLPRR